MEQELQHLKKENDFLKSQVEKYHQYMMIALNNNNRLQCTFDTGLFDSVYSNAELVTDDIIKKALECENTNGLIHIMEILIGGDSKKECNMSIDGATVRYSDRDGQVLSETTDKMAAAMCDIMYDRCSGLVQRLNNAFALQINGDSMEYSLNAKRIDNLSLLCNPGIQKKVLTRAFNTIRKNANKV